MSLALIEQYPPNISDPVYSVHQSFMWFLWLNWRKSTFYPVTTPNDSKCWPIVTSSIQEPVASNCDVTMTYCSRVVAMGAFLAQWCWGQRFNEFVKDTPVPRFSTLWKKSVKQWNVWQVTSWLTGKGQCTRFDQTVAAGYYQNVNVMIKLVKGAQHGANNGFDHIGVVSIVVFLPQWCWSQFVNTHLWHVFHVSLRYR